MNSSRNIYLSNMELSKAADLLGEQWKRDECDKETEVLPVIQCLDRVTAFPVMAKLSAPYFNASAMDGIAVSAESTYGANERNPVKLKKNTQYIVVDTGDPIADPWDSVVMIEDVTELNDEEVELRASVSPWDHVRPVGEDIVAGELILPSYHKITPVDIGALLSGGVTEIAVIRKPRVGLIPTGTEIIEPGDRIETGKIIESNSRVFEGIVTQSGGEAIRWAPVPDVYQELIRAVSEAAQTCDLVVINAGSSAGTEDFTSRVIGELGDVLVHGLAIKPGKPAILGIVNGKPVIGIPGYPVSAWVVFDALVKPMLYEMLHQRVPSRQSLKATVARRIVSSLKHQEFVRVKLGNVGGRIVATPLSRGAGVTMSLVKADGLLSVPLNSEGYEAGETVMVDLLRDIREIENTVVVTGSHDLVVDMLADVLHRKWPEAGLSSAHVGSLAGIMALQRSEAHVAPIHLLDEETGDYNQEFVRKMFPDFKGILVKGVKRVQGIMVLKGNPKNVESLGDLVRPAVRFVNRQRGSGTRLLLDYKLKVMGLESAAISGYAREMTTHMGVASAVLSGTADAGLGIQSAAETMGLDFIPVGVEEYDFLIPEQYEWEEPVQRFISALKSDTFHQRVLALGGYELDAPGTIVRLS